MSYAASAYTPNIFSILVVGIPPTIVCRHHDYLIVNINCLRTMKGEDTHLQDREGLQTTASLTNFVDITDVS